MKAIPSSRKDYYVARASIFLTMVALIAGIVGCVGGDGNNGGESYTLIIDFTAGGTVTVDDVPIPGKAILTYDAGTVVSLNATPSAGYGFVEWTGNVSTIADPNAASTTITMNGDHSIMANFHEIPVTYYTLTLAVNGSGSTSPSVGHHTYAAGTVVSITAAPAGGYRFVNWTGSVGTVALVIAATTTVTMNADYSVMANFEEGVVTSPDPNVGDTIRGPIREEGYIFPSDLQRHTFFSGTT